MINGMVYKSRPFKIDFSTLMRFIMYNACPHKVHIRRISYGIIEISIKDKDGKVEESAEYSLLSRQLQLTTVGWFEDIKDFHESKLSVKDYFEQRCCGLVNIQVGCKSFTSIEVVTPNHLHWDEMKKKYNINWNSYNPDNYRG